MLSRVADSIYWMSRYIERAENTARFVGVNLHLLLDLAEDFGGQWGALVKISGDHADFEARYDAPNEANVLHFLTFDEANPNSIISAVRTARENARSIREIISTETWEALNEFYLSLHADGSEQAALENPFDFFRDVRRAGHLLEGVMQQTMSQGEAWHFYRVGRLLERADKTTRILDIKYFLLLPDVQDVGQPIDDLHWSAVLRSASAFEMYRQRYGRVTSDQIVRFLLLDIEFPRSVRYCLDCADESLHAITGTSRRTFQNSGERRLGQLMAELDYTDEKEIVRLGLHEYLDQLQIKLNDIAGCISETFFATKPISGALQHQRQF